MYIIIQISNLLVQFILREDWRSSVTIFRRSIRLKQTDRTRWTIQAHTDELNWERRRNFHDLNSLSLIRLMKCSTFGLGLSSRHVFLESSEGIKAVWVYLIKVTNKTLLQLFLQYLCRGCSLQPVKANQIQTAFKPTLKQILFNLFNRFNCVPS